MISNPLGTNRGRPRLVPVILSLDGYREITPLRYPTAIASATRNFIRNSLKSCQRVRPSGPSSWHLSTQIGFGVSKENVDGQSNGIHLARRGTNVHARSTIPRKDQELAGIAHETQWRRAPTCLLYTSDAAD